MLQDLLDHAKKISAWLIDIRRDFHRHPEVSLQEEETSRRCIDHLKKLPGWIVRPNVWGHGFIADLEVPGARKRIALRADMDALPMQEENTHDFKSEREGVAHMCGHDAHMAIALGAARLLSERRGQLKHSVRLIFQPCEELPPGGALGMIAGGALEGVDEVYGLHNVPGLPVGVIHTRAGVLTAAADIFWARLIGQGGHAAYPEQTRDPIPAACALVSQLQTLISRCCSPFDTAVLSVTRISGGSTHNVVPEFCEIEGTVRTFDPEVRDNIESGIIRMLKSTAMGHRLRHEHKYTRGYDSIENHAVGVERLRAVVETLLPHGAFFGDTEPRSWGEDFAYYLQHRPGAFFLLGSGHPNVKNEPLHSTRFDINEECLPLGAAIMAGLALGD